MDTQIKLRELKKEDTFVTWKWRNQKAVQNHFSGHPFSVTQAQEEEWFSNVVTKDSTLKVFAIQDVHASELLGMTFLKNINLHHQQAEFAILIPAEFSGKGIGKVACRETVNYAFKELKLHRIFLKVRIDNPAAIRIYEASGFKIEGELCDDVFKEGTYSNQYIMAVLNPLK